MILRFVVTSAALDTFLYFHHYLRVWWFCIKFLGTSLHDLHSYFPVPWAIELISCFCFSCLSPTCTLRIKAEDSFAFFCALVFFCACSFLFFNSVPLLNYEAWSRYPFWKPFEMFPSNFWERKDIICSSSVWIPSSTLEGAEVTFSENGP